MNTGLVVSLVVREQRAHVRAPEVTLHLFVKAVNPLIF